MSVAATHLIVRLDVHRCVKHVSCDVKHGCKEFELKVSKNKMLRKIFGPKKDKLDGKWRKLHND
jgi:hypothetical protein